MTATSSEEESDWEQLKVIHCKTSRLILLWFSLCLQFVIIINRHLSFVIVVMELLTGCGLLDFKLSINYTNTLCISFFSFGPWATWFKFAQTSTAPLTCFELIPGPWFNIKMSSYQYRKSHCGDKTVVRSSYLHNGISYTDKMVSFYWISPQ